MDYLTKDHPTKCHRKCAKYMSQIQKNSNNLSNAESPQTTHINSLYIYVYMYGDATCIPNSSCHICTHECMHDRFVTTSVFTTIARGCAEQLSSHCYPVHHYATHIALLLVIKYLNDLPQVSIARPENLQGAYPPWHYVAYHNLIS